tara:strand:+ start:220 stop:588 length:369 start_codon:yes stop_codon:yes gene_type:complete
MRDNFELVIIAILLFVVLMGYTCSKAYAGEEYHAKIKPIKQQYCFTKIIITTKGDTVTKEEKLICADGRKNFDEPGYWELFSEFYYRDTNAPRYCRYYDRPNHAFNTPGKACLDKNGDWEVQ